MRTFNQYILKIFGGFVLSMSAFAAFAQQAAAKAVPAAEPPLFVFDVNTVLAIVAILLFLVLAVLAITLKSSMELYKRNVDNEKRDSGIAKTITMVIGLVVFSALTASAQTTAVANTAASDAVFSNSNMLRYLLIFIIFLELVAIFAVIKWMRFFTGIEDLQLSKGHKGIMGLSFSNWWRNFNKFKPIKEESEIDMGHSYDGIRELDNVLPPWFTWTFIATIVFGFAYLWRYHAAANPAPDQYQEYEQSVAQAKLKLDAYLAAKGDAVDETNVVMLGATDIASGAKIYQTNCVACHGDKGQGGVGPNLTDDYWKNGGSIGNVFKTIKLGVVEKGMQSWKDVFSATQIAQLSSYVKSLHGTNPPGGKAPEGDVYKETAAVADTAAAATAPTADSANKK